MLSAQDEGWERGARAFSFHVTERASRETMTSCDEGLERARRSYKCDGGRLSML